MIARNISDEHDVENQKNKGMKRMSQTLTVKVKLIPTKGQICLLEQSSQEYIKVINTLVSEMVEAIRRMDDKEQRWMQDKDHKISREIINFAIANHISVIRLEQLTNIRQTARTSRKNEKNLHTWSFYRLSQFISYKAMIAGIQIEYVNPAYTSQSCPKCAKKNKAQDRKYKCPCGFKTHRDIVGAMNIRCATVIDGNSQSA
ncbi:RNA-guided endonuclease TnpB family protein [Bacillus mycoides]|uniref:RNA-guided endonuclease TnpB family protein n=1 Tax=Bacillus mycoides TaxID=1405 RepID=UPI00355B48AB